MRKRHKDLVGDDEIVTRRIIYYDDNEYYELKDNNKKYLYQQYDKNRGIKYTPKNKKGGRHDK